MKLLQIIKSEKLKTMIKDSWELSWPMIFIMFYEFLIGFADVYVASKFGKTAQAAYGFSFQVYFVFIMIGIALSVGIVSVVSRLFTSGNSKMFNTSINSSIALTAFFGIIFSLSGILFSEKLINILKLPQEVKVLSISFVKIYSLAFLFDYILMSANGILRACKMIKKSLLVMSIVCTMNLALNFILSFYTPLKLSGIAWATVISLFTGAVISLFYVRKLITSFDFSFALIKNIIIVSWPSGLLQAFWQLSSLVLFLILSLLPANNVEIMAALTNGLKIESAIFLPAFAFNMSAAVIVGNFLGRKEEKNAFYSGIITAMIGVFVVTVLTVIIMLNAKHIAAFLSDNNIVINESVRYIYIALLFEPVMAWAIILGGGLSGAGDTMSVMLVTALSVWLVRIPLCYVLGIYFGLGSIAIWWAMNGSILVQAIFITIRYFNKKWIAQAALAS